MTSLRDIVEQPESHHKALVTFAGKGPNGPEYHTPLGRLTEAQIAAMLEADLKAEMAAEAARQPAPLPPAGKPEIAPATVGPALSAPTVHAEVLRPAETEAAATVPAPEKRRRRLRLVHWRAAAVMIARGVGITYIAQDAGVCESVILRNLQRSARFRRWIREAEAAVEADAARHAAWLRLRAASSLADRAEARDAKTLELLARQIGDLTRGRVEEAAGTRPDSAFARLSGYSKKDFAWNGAAGNRRK